MRNQVVPSGLAALGTILHWRRLVISMAFATLGGLMLSPGWTPGPASVIFRVWEVGFVALLVFGVLERWPRRLPSWLARWVAQVVGVGLSVPLTTLVIYLWNTPPGGPAFWEVPARREGFQNICVLGALLGPWVALGALVRQKEALAQHQALGFALERSELEREVLDARMRLLQAQVAPHFLFNTLANVQALVETQAPQAPQVLRNLIGYLRASVPRLDDAETTLGDELGQVRAYLELMQLRMADRLEFRLDADPESLALVCPPVTLLTLVENAIRHGIDPSEEGGRISVEIRRGPEQCTVRVVDTGVGMAAHGGKEGTGLSGLRERIALFYGPAASLCTFANPPHGVVAELVLPIRPEGRA
ncbi:MAG: histidine kinase [Candidatus Eisenbacteria bacterium]